jgi:hypothetical protein
VLSSRVLRTLQSLGHIYIFLKELNFSCISGTSKSRLHSNNLLYGVTDWFIGSRSRISNYKSRKRSLVCLYLREYKVGWGTKEAKIRFNALERTCGRGALCCVEVAANMTGGPKTISMVKCLLRSQTLQFVIPYSVTYSTTRRPVELHLDTGTVKILSV